MPGKTKRSESNKNYYASYKSGNQQQTNKLKKIDKHLKKHPNDAQTLNSIK